MDKRIIEKHLKNTLVLKVKVELLRANYDKLKITRTGVEKENLKNILMNNMNEILKLTIQEQKRLNKNLKPKPSKKSADG